MRRRPLSHYKRMATRHHRVISSLKKMKPLIKIVIPDGSMQDVVTNFFAKAGLTTDVPWIRLELQRPQEIPHYLHHGHFDVAIVGEDWIANWGYEFPVLLKMPIGRGGNKAVKIVLAVK